MRVIVNMSSKQEPRSLTRFRTNRLIAFTMLALGITLIGLSVFYYSSVSSIIGLALTFWGALLLYITPTKHVPLQLLNAVATASITDIERLLEESGLKEKGIYLPPKHLADYESSLIFIPKKKGSNLPTSEQTSSKKFYCEKPPGALFTPPGLALSKLFEKEFGKSFTKTDLKTLKENLPKLLVEDLEIAEQVQVNQENNMVKILARNTVLNQICAETKNLQRVHNLIGSILGSALACIFAKSAGKPVTIENEELTENGKNLQIKLSIIEE
jgi:hypothetical protein